jgi:hypothetical protein
MATSFGSKCTTVGYYGLTCFVPFAAGFYAGMAKGGAAHISEPTTYFLLTTPTAINVAESVVSNGLIRIIWAQAKDPVIGQTMKAKNPEKFQKPMSQLEKLANRNFPLQVAKMGGVAAALTAIGYGAGYGLSQLVS